MPIIRVSSAHSPSRPMFGDLVFEFKVVGIQRLAVVAGWRSDSLRAVSGSLKDKVTGDEGACERQANL